MKSLLRTFSHCLRFDNTFATISFCSVSASRARVSNQNRIYRLGNDKTRLALLLRVSREESRWIRRSRLRNKMKRSADRFELHFDTVCVMVLSWAPAQMTHYLYRYEGKEEKNMYDQREPSSKRLAAAAALSVDTRKVKEEKAQTYTHNGAVCFYYNRAHNWFCGRERETAPKTSATSRRVFIYSFSWIISADLNGRSNTLRLSLIHFVWFYR